MIGMCLCVRFPAVGEKPQSLGQQPELQTDGASKLIRGGREAELEFKVLVFNTWWGVGV